jgi:hypothetical protein
MNADISELENKLFFHYLFSNYIYLLALQIHSNNFRELLDKIKKFENEQFSSKKSSHQVPKLEPVNDTGGTILLREVRK